MRSNACALLFTTTLSVLLCQINSESFFGIGHRVYGDRLLVKDEIENRHTGFTDIPIIQFSYKITEPLSCIEITSEKNVLAEVHFGYYDSLINGTVTAISTLITATNKNEPFRIRILIYGFNETHPIVNPEDILRQQIYDGALEPTRKPGQIDHMEMMNIDNRLEFSESMTTSDEVERVNGDAEEEDGIFDSMDNIIEIGERQPGDYLLYQTEQTSFEPTEQPTEHKVTFYYIDDAYITYIQIQIFDFFNNEDDETDKRNISTIEYHNYTPSRIKIIITDPKTTSLFAKMSVYGYSKDDLPLSYKYYVPQKVLDQEKKVGIATETPETYMQHRINELYATSHQKLDGLPRPEKIDLNVNADSKDCSPNSSSSTINQISIIYSLGLVAIVCKLWSLVISCAW